MVAQDDDGRAFEIRARGKSLEKLPELGVRIAQGVPVTLHRVVRLGRKVVRVTIKGNMRRYRVECQKPGSIGRQVLQHPQDDIHSQAVRCSGFSGFGHFPVVSVESLDKRQRVVKDRIGNRHVLSDIIRHQLGKSREVVGCVEAWNVAVWVGRKSEVGRHGAADRRISSAEGVLEPETAPSVQKVPSLGKRPEVRRKRRVARKHLVENAPLEGLPENEDNVVGTFCPVFPCRRLAVCGKLPVDPFPVEILGQKGVEIGDKFVRNLVIVLDKFKGLFGGNVQNRSGQRVLSEREPHIDLCSEDGNRPCPARSGEKQRERDDGKEHARGKKEERNIEASRLDFLLLLSGKVEDYRGESGDIDEEKRKPAEGPLEISAERGNGCRIGDVRQVKVGAQKRVGEPLVRKSEDFVIDRGEDEVEDEECGKGSRLPEKGEEGNENENRSVCHGNLPDGLPGEHFRQGKSQRIGERVEEREHRALQKDGEQGNQDKGIHNLIRMMAKKPHGERETRKASGCST